MPKTTILLTAYIGTYTRSEPFVDGKGKGIYICTFNPETGALKPRSTVSGIINPSFLAVSSGGDRLYAVNEISGELEPGGLVSAFAIDPITKDLTHLNSQPTHGSSPCHLSVDGSDRTVLVANYGSGSFCVLPILEDGRLDQATDVIQLHGSGVHPRQSASHAHMITPGPGSRFIYGIDLGTDRILSYRLDRVSGKLDPGDPPSSNLPSGTGPRHLIFHPNGRFAYVIGELQSTIITLQYDNDSGALYPVQTLSTLPDDFSGQNLAAEIQVAPSGNFVYASNRGHDSIAMFTVDQETGVLTGLGHEPSLGVSPRYFCIDSKGDFLLVANQDSDTVVTFRIIPNSGTLRAAGSVTKLPTPVCIYLL